MKILYVASEMAPYARSGGLGDVIGALPFAIAELGHEVAVFIPRYRHAAREELLVKAIPLLEVSLGKQLEVVRVWSARARGGVDVYFIDHPESFDRDGLYGTPQGPYPDNDRRFALFQKAVIESIRKLRIRPDVVHCHDWQTGLIPLYLKRQYQKVGPFKHAQVVFTFHNLSHLGLFPPDSLALLDLDWPLFAGGEIQHAGRVCFLKAGVVFADAVSTVSQRYAEEVQSPPLGSGLEALFRSRADELFGIPNGIDVAAWDPERDPELETHFRSDDAAGKQAAKTRLQRENQMPERAEVPLVGMISRLAEQKGLEIVEPALEALRGEDFQFVLLGRGEPDYQDQLSTLAREFPDRIRVHLGFDRAMAKRIFAGSDFFLIPSRFEPCGQNQLLAYRYGAVPVARSTGGLAETIEDFDPQSGRGTGILFEDYSSEALAGALRRAFSAYRTRKHWNALRRNASSVDVSWASRTDAYLQLYRHAAKKR